ncbi:MAG: bifunctional oligoribonuclease/PAP phosphatase NrnA [Candidatus Omnitrophica bacterium]|nr:bifunctional oligoribonuclease/PAP phosphatase NrnA [Candidatus Omnitrophota bacterium]
MVINEIRDALRKYDNFVVTSHIDPEPDALGSELAVYELLKRLGKMVTIINDKPVPEEYDFLEGTSLMRHKYEKSETYGAAVVVDCPTTKRTGSVRPLLEKVPFIVNIDHHISNEKFGNINWVNPDASCAGEMIYTLYKAMDVEISRKVALYIYTAILTDTGSFNYTNTSGVTHAITSELIGYGINPYQVSHHVYENKKYQDVKLLGDAIRTLGLALKGKVAYMVCTKRMLKKNGSAISATQDFVNIPRSVKGTLIALFLREEPGKNNSYRVSLRSRGNVSVNKIAAQFGGGGHKYAAGCIVKGTLQIAKRRLIEAAREELERYA